VDEEAVAEHGPSFQDILAIARRRIWWLIVPILLGPILGYLISLQVKPVFTSQAFVLVEQQKVPDAFVPSMVMDQLEIRLMTMQDQILSRSRLQPIIEEFGLYQSDNGHPPMDELVARLRQDITITPIRPDASALRGFYIKVNADNAGTAQRVCTRVLTMFMDENLKTRSERAESTTQFLTSQLDDAKRKLDDNDAKLAEFKTRYLGRLPSDEQNNLQMLSTLSSRLDAVNESIAQMRQQRVTQMAMLAQQTASSRPASAVSSSPSEMEKQLSDLRAQLATLEARYTPEHPEVIAIKEQIEALQQKLQRTRATAPPPQASAVPVPEAPETTQLRASIDAVDEGIKTKKAEQARLEQEINSFQARIQLSPVVEEQYKVLTRDYNSALQFYNDLLAKKTQSEMVRDLEQRREGEQFHVMDAPSLPSKPSSPKRIKFALGGLASGFALGVVLAGILDLSVKRIRTERDVSLYLEIPILGTIQDLDHKLKVSGQAADAQKSKSAVSKIAV
jgi:polysaccharide chain length determinant protein (PEP-CTERM system associated)